MAFLEKDEVQEAYEASVGEAKVWRENYPEFERLADNGLRDDLDESLPEVNDGTLAASLFKLPKRIVNSDLAGRAKAVDTDESWITELANIEWTQQIIPNANSQASFHRKWKDAVRKAAIYGSIPIINLFLERGDYTGSDFIVAQAQDVKLEAGKVSDQDSDIIFWDIYYTKLQLKNMIEEAKEEMADSEKSTKVPDQLAKATNTSQADGFDEDDNEDEAYNYWDVVTLEEILNKHMEEDRNPDEENRDRQGKGVKRGGYHFYVAFQRGVSAPFEMRHSDFPDKPVRQWSNPDPTGDIPVHYLYCYQDFINPYGIGIVKLAGGTQNSLDYFRQADIKATMLGIEQPLRISGDTDKTDLDSIVYEQRAQWMLGDATVEPQEIANGVYQALPSRISMYKTSLNQLIPTGDTSIGADAGDPNYSKTPAGVKFQATNLSIDDEDFKDNLYITYGLVARSMINTHFANMQGQDIRKLSDEDRDILIKAGLPWPGDETGQPSTNALNVVWKVARAKFEYEVDAEQDKTKDDEQKLNGLLSVAKFAASDPSFDAYLAQDGKKLNRGELFADIIGLSSDNKKIIEDVSPEDQQQMQEQAQSGGQEQQKSPSESITFKDAIASGATDAAAAMLEQAGLPSNDLVNNAMEAKQMQAQQAQAQAQATEAAILPQTALSDPRIQELAQQHKIAPNIAAAMLEAESAGFDPAEILSAAQRHNMMQSQGQKVATTPPKPEMAGAAA